MSESFDTIISNVLDDRRLSRGERKVLQELLADSELDDHRQGLLMHSLFEHAASRMSHPADREILGAVRELVNLLRPLEQPKAAGRMAEVHFSPSSEPHERIRQLIDDTRHTLDICVYTITDDRLANAIIRAHQRHVKVRIISDDEKATDLGSDIYRLAAQGISVALDFDIDFMHHKFALFDHARLLTGSYNWTRSAASRNWENVIVTDDPRLVAAFADEFDRLYKSFDRLVV